MIYFQIRFYSISFNYNNAFNSIGVKNVSIPEAKAKSGTIQSKKIRNAAKKACLNSPEAPRLKITFVNFWQI